MLVERKAYCHDVANASLSRLKLVRLISSLKIFKMWTMHFLKKALRVNLSSKWLDTTFDRLLIQGTLLS